MFSPAIGVVLAGSSHVAGQKVRRIRPNRFRIEHASVETFKSCRIGEPEWCELAEAALNRLVAVGVPSGPIVLVVPSQLLLTRQLLLPAVSDDKLAELIAYEVRQGIPIEAENLVWSHGELATSKAGKDLLLCAGKTAAIEAICAVMENVGFSPRFAIPGSLAVLGSARQIDRAWDPGNVLVHIDGLSVVVVFKDAERAFARQFAPRCLQSRAAGSVSAEGDPAILGAALAEEVRRSLAHFSGPGAVGGPTQCVINGARTLPEGWIEEFQHRMQMPVRQLELEALVETDGAGPGHDPAVAVGASLLAFADGHEAELLPKERRRKASASVRKPWFVGAATATLLAVVPPIVSLHHQLCEIRTGSVALAKELDPLRAKAEANKRALGHLVKVQEQLGVFSEFEDRQHGWVQLLAGIQEALDDVEDVWIDRVKVIRAGEAPRGKGNGVDFALEISGRMLDRAGQHPSGESVSRRFELLKKCLRGASLASRIERESFDRTQPGILGFAFTLIPDPELAL